MDSGYLNRVKPDGNHLASVGALVSEVEVTGPKRSVKEIKKYFDGDEPIKAVVIIEDEKPVGLVMNIHLDRILSQRFGVALYYDKPIKKIMDETLLIVDCDTSIEKAADLAMRREKSKLFDHIIVTRKGKLSGIVAVRDILNAMIEKQKENADEMSQINKQLHQEIEDRLKIENDLIKFNRELEDRVAIRTAEIRQSNEKLKKAAEAADAANQAKSDFLANMSHELRTPLNHIIGFTEIVLEQHFGVINEKQAEYLSDVLSSSNHLLSLINDILDLSKVEAGKLELNKSEIDLQNLLENSLTMIKEKAQKHNIRLSTRFDKIPMTIEGDARKLKQILYNLLSNSVKFTPDGGNICLSARGCIDNISSELENSDTLPQNFSDNLLEISVKDSGIGLKEEDRERIFQPFEQADKARNRKFQGTGLGLSLTKKLVELHRGHIWVESNGEGAGSDFKFIIPDRQ
ncbi:MAG: ATP-binding protein [Desulfobacteraceae bacterium]|jgi:signal transduction histidine kinase/CBS domain-containing protein